MTVRLIPTSLSLLALAVLAPGSLAQCEFTKVTAADASGSERFGQDVCLFGDTALVGAWFKSSGGYVFERQGSLWVQTAKLSRTNDAGGSIDSFGYSVACSGNTALVADPDAEPPGSPIDSGAVYVYDKPPGGWADMTQTATLTASGAGYADGFGTAIALFGDTALVGDQYEDLPGHLNSGAAYLFERREGVWTQTAKLTPSDPEAHAHFGNSVSIFGDTILVGATYKDDAGAYTGAAYVFERPAGGWQDMTETAKLLASDAAADSFFGIVSLFRDTALIGAPQDDAVGKDSGSAYVFERQGSVWVQTAKLTASDGAPGDQLGVVSLFGDTAAVGAFGEDGDRGSVYLFRRPSGGWVDMTETAKYAASDGDVGDELGYSVSLFETTVLVGAHGDDDAGPESGSAYVITASGPCLSHPTPGTAGLLNTVTVSQATAGGILGVGVSAMLGSTPVGSICPGLIVELDNPTVVGLMTADGTGNASFSGFVPASLSGKTVFLQAGDLAACEVSNLVSHTFP